MRKISMILFTTLLLVSFAACKGDKKADEAVQETATEVVAPPVEEAPAVVEPTPAEALKAFQAFAKEYGEAFNNLTKDPQKFQKLAGEVQQKIADMERIKIDLTPAQVKVYEKALKIITDVNSGGTRK
ncbi:MAG: hypothetical protein LBS46_08310 [Dysgonamonadaceae bacterium]|jgi:hypothetical protein|nr:hypothetical protein [Dysgonamonadaceae bacterium]